MQSPTIAESSNDSTILELNLIKIVNTMAVKTDIIEYWSTQIPVRTFLYHWIYPSLRLVGYVTFLLLAPFYWLGYQMEL